MGLFDRIRGKDEEVELRPAESRDTYDFRREEAAEEDDSDDEFVLPGMKPASSTSSSGSSSRSSPRSSSTRRTRDDGIDRVIEQNERIIELLEEIAGSGSGTDSVL